MKKVFITGTSRGLGKALAEVYLKEGHKVVGLSRSSTILEENYEHCIIDLSELKAVEAFQFDIKGTFEEVILINNAASLGEVKHIGALNNVQIAKAIQLNVVTPMILANKFTAASCNENCKRFVLNIGSGASSSAVDGWGLYCSSKAALDMFNEVFEKENQKKAKAIKMRTLAPGIIDTAMQEEIRNSDSNHFFEKERFVTYKTREELASAEETAKKIMLNFDLIFNNRTAVQSIRNY